MELAPGPQPILLPPPADQTLSCCPYCQGTFVQPRSWRELGDGKLRLKLQCPECQVLMVGTFDAGLVARYDEQLTAGRRALSDSYAEVVRENLKHEAELLRQALALDLIGPDDFR